MARLRSFRSYYSREIESHSEKKAAIVLGLFIFNLVFFGYFGFYKGIKSAKVKIDTIGEYNQATQRLTANYDRLALLEPELESSKGVAALNSLISTGDQAEDYLETLAQAVAQHGYVVERFTVARSGTEAVTINLDMSGDSTRMSQAIESLENLERLTRVNKVTIDSGRRNSSIEGTAEMRIDMTIYQVKKDS